MAIIFFSYSHEDEQLRDELEKHLAMLKRQGLIRTWHDRRVTAGRPLDNTISANLQAADIILLLVSPDFLASNYCYDREVRRAMQRHESGDATVIPIILRPCDWSGAPFARLLAAPRDGKPVTTWADRDQAFLDITEAIKAELGRRQAAPAPAPPQSATRQSKVQSARVRLPRVFSEREKDDFLEQAFGHIATFFENSLAGLQQHNPGIETRFRRVDANRFTSVVYRHGRAEARCTIWMGSRESFAGGIAYSESDSGSTSSFNESLSVEADEQSLYLKPFGLAFVGRPGPEEKLTMEAAAEFLWGLFVEKLNPQR